MAWQFLDEDLPELLEDEATNRFDWADMGEGRKRFSVATRYQRKEKPAPPAIAVYRVRPYVKPAPFAPHPQPLGVGQSERPHRVCAQCRRPYTATWACQKYCTHACHQARVAHKQTAPKKRLTCAVCGTVFEHHLPFTKYCTDVCARRVNSRLRRLGRHGDR